MEFKTVNRFIIFLFLDFEALAELGRNGSEPLWFQFNYVSIYGRRREVLLDVPLGGTGALIIIRLFDEFFFLFLFCSFPYNTMFVPQTCKKSIEECASRMHSLVEHCSVLLFSCNLFCFFFFYLPRVVQALVHFGHDHYRVVIMLQRLCECLSFARRIDCDVFGSLLIILNLWTCKTWFFLFSISVIRGEGKQNERTKIYWECKAIYLSKW
jgi:hypothetical protein